MSRSLSMFSCALAIACGVDGGAATGDDPSATTSADSSTSEGGDASSSGVGESTAADSTGAGANPYDCVESDFMVVAPLAGPGYDPEAGLVEPQAQYVVSTTVALPRPEASELFGQLVGAAATEAAQSDGFVAASFAVEPHCGFNRTLTVWRDEASMMAFVLGPAHAQAIAQAPQAVSTGQVTHFTIDAAQMPIEWDAALAELADVTPFVY